MNEKYITIKRKDGICWSRWPKEQINPDDIIFLIRSIDTTYDHASEDLGHFCQIAYCRGDEIVWENFNPKASEPIDELLEQAGDKLDCIYKNDYIQSCYLGRPRADFQVEGGDLIYQNKYRFKQPESNDSWGNSDFEKLVQVLESNKSK